MQPDTTPISNGSFSPQPETSNTPSESRGGVGAIIGAIIVIALLIAGGFYFWGSYLNQKAQPEQLPLIVGDAAPAVQGNGDLSTSDATAHIQADVDSGYLDTLQQNLEADMQAIENDLQNL